MNTSQTVSSNRHPFSASTLARFVQDALRERADPSRAPPMAAYMKTDMPFYGVPKSARLPILKAMHKQFIPPSPDAYIDGVQALWQLRHREEKYTAIDFAIRHSKYITPAAMPMYEQLIREGAWWDLVDAVATLLVGRVLLNHRTETATTMEKWIDDKDMWIRRAALLAHLKHKTSTDQAQLFAHCLRLAGEKEFFIRKALGWVLREYAKTSPDAVNAFLRAHQALLSPLSMREASKHLVRASCR